jgi:hypothetical protein
VNITSPNENISVCYYLGDLKIDLTLYPLVCFVVVVFVFVCAYLLLRTSLILDWESFALTRMA